MSSIYGVRALPGAVFIHRHVKNKQRYRPARSGRPPALAQRNKIHFRTNRSFKKQQNGFKNFGKDSPVIGKGLCASGQRQHQISRGAGRGAYWCVGAGGQRGGLHRAPMCTGRARLCVCDARLPSVAFLKIIRKNVTRVPTTEQNMCDANISPVPWLDHCRTADRRDFIYFTRDFRDFVC